jgi:hypothetical protein
MSDSKANDQVARQIEFLREHPGVTIEYREETWRWEAGYPGDGGTETISASELKEVLDRLDKHFGESRSR